MLKNKSVFSRYKESRPINSEVLGSGLLSISGLQAAYDPKTSDFVLGPKLNKKSNKSDVAEKIRQIHTYYYIDSLYKNKESLPLFPKYEKEIIKFSFPSFVYSYYFMKKPWPDAEKIISKDKTASILYATRVLKKRFELGESAMKEDPEICLAYCIAIMKRKTLPKIMHQAMLLNSLKDGNKFAKRYLSYKAVMSEK